MKITNQKSLELISALRKLNNITVEDVKTAYAISKNFRALAPIEQDLIGIRNKLIAELSGGGDHVDENGPEAITFKARMEELLQQEEEVALFRIDWEKIENAMKQNSLLNADMIGALEVVLDGLPLMIC